MNVYDVVRADQLPEVEGPQHILIIRQVKRVIVRIPVENVTATDMGDSILVKGYSLDTGESVTYFILPDEDVELWEA